jgi:hypothetical protein
MDLFVAGRDHSVADKPNNLAEGHSHLQPTIENQLWADERNYNFKSQQKYD